MATKLLNGVRSELTAQEIAQLPPEMTQAQITEEQAKQARAERTSLLAASDWTQVADTPVDQSAWATYRQALRDVTDQTGFPDAIAWPVAPE